MLCLAELHVSSCHVILTPLMKKKCTSFKQHIFCKFTNVIVVCSHCQKASKHYRCLELHRSCGFQTQRVVGCLTFFSLLLLNLFLAHSKLTCEFKTLNVFNANILTLLPSFIFFKKLVRQLLTTLFFF